MKILCLYAYFKPEIFASSRLQDDLLEGISDAGHTVEIVCPIPTRGIDKDTIQKYHKIKSENLYGGSVHVTRFYSPQEGKNPVIRALRYFWCNLRTYQIGKKACDVDIVYCGSTPPTQGLIAGKIAKKLGIPFVYSLEDVFPDSLVTTGLARDDSILFKIGRKIENCTYNYCSHIVVISNAIRENVKNKGVLESKISVISNWIDTSKIKPVLRKDNGLFDELSISREKFIVVYAGNFGAAQGAEIILDVAKMLVNNQQIHFVIFGGGAGFSHAVDIAKTMKNVTIRSLLPIDRISEVYSMGNVAIITCKKGVGNSGFPSKTWSIMACNVPIIASFDEDSELNAIISKSNAGVCVEPEDVIALKEAILTESKHAARKVDSRNYVQKYASRESCVTQYIDLFENVVKRLDI